MNRIKKLLTIALLAVSLIACTAVHASPGTEPQVVPSPTAQDTLSEIELEAILEIPATLPSGEEVNLRFTLVNSTDTRLYVLKWYTPLEGLAGKIFAVERDGEVIPYEGIMAYRVTPSSEAYVALDVGESVSAEVDLAAAYDFSKAGEYTIEFISPTISHVARTESEMAETVEDLGPVQMSSNKVTVIIERSSAPRRGSLPADGGGLAHSPGQDLSPASPGVPRTITVVGTGKVSLVPDVARINIGAEALADTVSGAKTEVDRRIAAIIDALTEPGVDEKDIQTSHYSIHYERELTPVVREGPARESQDGYRVSNMLRVTVRDVEKAGAVLDAVVEAGANQVWGVTFAVSDESKWQNQAREKAMADTKARASELADLAGVKLGEVMSVSEVIGGMPMPRAMGGGSDGIAPGELELGIQIQVTFAIR